MSNETNIKLAAGLAKIGLVLRQHAWKVGGESGLTPTQGQVLVLLLAREPAEGLAMSDVAAQLGLTPATVSDSVAALERKGLVTRGRDARDARIVRARLTPEGENAARQSSVWPDMLLMAIETLDADEQAVFVRGLVKMIYALQSSGQIPLARMCPTCTYFHPHAHAGSAKPHHCAFVDAPLGDIDLRMECADHRAVQAEEVPRLWQLFIRGEPQPSPTGRAESG